MASGAGDLPSPHRRLRCGLGRTAQRCGGHRSESWPSTPHYNTAQYRAKWLHEIALAWPQERQKKKEDATICQVPAYGFLPDWHESDVVRV
jgi:hypothetical protein